MSEAPPLALLNHAITEAHVFKINKEKLMNIFKFGGERTGLMTINEHGGATGLTRKLASDPASGITGDELDLKRRTIAFGKNERVLAPMPTMIDMIREIIDDKIWLVIYASATVLCVLEGIFLGLSGMAQGLSIIAGTTIIILILAVSNYQKNKQFYKVKSKLQDQNVTAIRGKFEQAHEINAWGLVAGDVITLHSGERVPADCLVIESSELKIRYPEHLKEDKTYEDGDTVDGFDKPYDDQILYADSYIERGQCKALVCCVGKNSSRAFNRDGFKLNQDTPLQTKLKNLSD